MSNSNAITSGLIPELYKLIIVVVCSTLSDNLDHHLIYFTCYHYYIYNNSKYFVNTFTIMSITCYKFTNNKIISFI